MVKVLLLIVLFFGYVFKILAAKIGREKFRFLNLELKAREALNIEC